MDSLEKQLRDVQSRNDNLVRTQNYVHSPYKARAPDYSLAAERSQREASVAGQSALQSEVWRLQDEKENIEEEALAFKQRMEVAVSSFETIIEQAVREKADIYEQLQTARRQLSRAGHADAVADMEAATDERIAELEKEKAQAVRERDRAVREAQESSEREDQQAERAQRQVAQLQASLAAAEAERDRLTTAMSSSVQSHKAKTEAIESELRSTARAASGENAGLARQVSELEASLADATKERERQQAASAQVVLERDQALREARELERFRAGLARQVAQLEGSLAEVEAEREKLQSTSSSAELSHAATVQQLETAQAGLTKQVSGLEASLARSEAEREQFLAASRSVEETQAAQVQQLESQVATLARQGPQEVARLTKQLSGLEASLAEAETERDRLVASSRKADEAIAASDQAIRETRQLSASLAEANAEREKLQAAAQSADAMGRERDQALREARETESKARETESSRAALASQVAQLEASLAQARAAPPVTAPPTANGAASGAKVQALSQMLQEQQQELADSYVFAAGSKLQAVMVGAKVATQARALATWRGACIALAGDVQPASGGVDTAVHDRAVQRARELESSRAALARQVAQLEASLAEARAARPPAAVSGRTAKTDALSRMLQEQQETLSESYVFAMRMKLQAMLGGTHVAAQTRALATWRGACVALSLAAARPAAAPPAASGAVDGAKVQALSQMLQEQQQELASSYMFAAGSKLQAVMVGARVTTQARALATWRGACNTLVGSAQPASGGADAAAAIKERDRAVQQARELEASLAEARAEREKLVAASRNAEQSHALKVQQLRNELESSASFAEEEEPEANGAASSAKMQALSQMLQEQQQELAEGYVFAAGSKLRAVLVGATVATQARALATWRGACIARAGDAQPAVPVANGTARGAKMQALSQMLQEQQQELADSYVFAAGSKLQAVMVGAKVATQARALATWRGVCMLPAAPASSQEEASLREQLRAMEAESKRHAMDKRSMGILVTDLEAQVRGRSP